MKLKDIMTKNVATLHADDTVEQAAHLMKQYNIGSVPVCNGEEIIGIITDRDIAVRSVAEGENFKNQKVRDIMTSNPVIATQDMDIHDAARIMSERQIRRLPVAHNKNIVGIISLGDIAVENNLKDNAGEVLSNISEPSSPFM